MLKHFWVLTLVLAAWYAPQAAQYMWPYRHGPDGLPPNGTQREYSWSEQHFAWLTSPVHSYGPGNVHEYFSRAFKRIDTRTQVSFHTAAGGLALFFMSMQFATPLRRNDIQLHRATGYCAYGAQALTLYGSASHLWAHGADHYQGPEFTAVLWVLWCLSAVAMVTSFVYIGTDRRDVRLHRGWSSLNFATMLSAPVLRVGWVLIHRIGVPGTQKDTHNAVITFDFLVLMFGAGVFLTLSAPVPRFQRSVLTSWAPGIAAFQASQLIGLFGLVALVHEVVGVFAFLDPWTWSVNPPEHTADSTYTSLPYAASARVALLAGVAGLHALLPAFARQSLTTGGHVSPTLRAVTYASFATAAYGAWHYYFRVALPHSPSLAWPVCFPALIAGQFACFAMELCLPAMGDDKKKTKDAEGRGSSGAAKSGWALLGWCNCLGLAWAFGFGAALHRLWPDVYPRVVALGAGAGTQAVPWVVGLLAILYYPRVPPAKPKTA